MTANLRLHCTSKSTCIAHLVTVQSLYFSIYIAYDYEEVDTTLSGLAGGFFAPPSLSLNAYQDGVAEQLEGFVLLLEIVQSELDGRDVGNVSLSRSAYLVRINQSGIPSSQAFFCI